MRITQNVENHLSIISACFGSNMCNSFWEKDWNL